MKFRGWNYFTCLLNPGIMICDFQRLKQANLVCTTQQRAQKSINHSELRFIFLNRFLEIALQRNYLNKPLNLFITIENQCQLHRNIMKELNTLPTAVKQFFDVLYTSQSSKVEILTLKIVLGVIRTQIFFCNEILYVKFLTFIKQNQLKQIFTIFTSIQKLRYQGYFIRFQETTLRQTDIKKIRKVQRHYAKSTNDSRITKLKQNSQVSKCQIKDPTKTARFSQKHNEKQVNQTEKIGHNYLKDSSIQTTIKDSKVKFFMLTFVKILKRSKHTQRLQQQEKLIFYQISLIEITYHKEQQDIFQSNQEHKWPIFFTILQEY